MQEEAENGDDIPEEDEVVVSKDAVVVTVPADFTLEESCQELMDRLSIVIFKCALLQLFLLMFSCLQLLPAD